MSKIFYEDEKTRLIYGDSFIELRKLEEKSVDLIFADPPYFLSTDNGISCHSGRMVSVKKAEWDMKLTVNEKHKFNRKWIRLCKRVLKDDGSIWISGTMSNIYSIGLALEQEGFKILNNVTWEKLNPPPNISCRYFVHSTETVLWAKKDIKEAKHYFNYSLMREMNNNKQAKDVWRSPLTPRSEKKLGVHPTQKPIWLIEKILLAGSESNAVILDPFNGSGTTCIASRRLGRSYIGIDNVEEYLELTLRRILNEEKL